MSQQHTFERSLFAISRGMEYFSEKELAMQIGHPLPMWPVAILKELIDNALDAGECAGVTPDVVVELADDYFAVTDNGPGMPREVILRAQDISTRISDKALYVSPTRGQQGNGLKTVWTAPFVACGEGAGTVEVLARGILSRLTPWIDHIAGVPGIKLQEVPSDVSNGTVVRVVWPGASGIRIPPWVRDLLPDTPDNRVVGRETASQEPSQATVCGR